MSAEVLKVNDIIKSIKVIIKMLKVIKGHDEGHLGQ